MNFLQFSQAHGLQIRDLIHGSITRCPTASHPLAKNGAYYLDDLWGWVQDWAAHPEIIIWKTDKILSPSDIAEQKKRMEASKKAYRAERAKLQQQAARKAKWILGECELDLHKYLAVKGWPEAVGNIWKRPDKDPLLCIPMRVGSEIFGVQMIAPDGQKKFLYGQRCHDAAFVIGNGENVFLVEGYASGLSLQAALDALKIKYTIHVCFSAGNMARVAKGIPGAILICDNDVSGTGQRVGLESGRRWWMSDSVGEDVNDYSRRVEKFAASQAIRKFLTESKK